NRLCCGLELYRNPPENTRLRVLTQAGGAGVFFRLPFSFTLIRYQFRPVRRPISTAKTSEPSGEVDRFTEPLHHCRGSVCVVIESNRVATVMERFFKRSRNLRKLSTAFHRVKSYAPSPLDRTHFLILVLKLVQLPVNPAHRQQLLVLPRFAQTAL